MNYFLFDITWYNKQKLLTEKYTYVHDYSHVCKQNLLMYCKIVISEENSEAKDLKVLRTRSFGILKKIDSSRTLAQPGTTKQ